MNPDPLDDLLSSYSRQPLPPAPDFTPHVWSTIKQRRSSFWSRLLPAAGWDELFREPRLAVPAFALVLVIGLLPAITFVNARRESQLARDSLHFDVFSTMASNDVLRVAVSGTRVP